MNTKTAHPTIAMTSVKSSQIRSIGYDAATKTLAVRFHGGGLYHYADVPQEKFDAMNGTPSVGAYLGAHIKGAHKFRKVEG